MSRVSKKLDKAVEIAKVTEAGLDRALGKLPCAKAFNIPLEQRIHKLFTYKDGRLYRKIITNAPRQKVGEEIGWTDGDGYRRCEIDGVSYGVHRLIWLYHKGYLPKFIDHINRIKDDNHIENLRECTLSENSCNVAMKSNNTSGVLGVSFDKSKGKYVARVTACGEVHYLGAYDSIDIAEQVVVKARRELHKHFAADTKDTVEPWNCCPDVWKTKAMFFQWMRGQMRRAWSRHPVKVSYMHNHRERVPLGRKTAKNPTGLVWGCRCEHCNNLFKQTECEVDHLDAAGSFKGWDDFEAWMHKLMHINWDSIRVVCKECHRIISYAERMGYTFEEAKLEKEVITFTKITVPSQKDILNDVLGYAAAAKITNAKQRRAAYKQYLQERL